MINLTLERLDAVCGYAELLGGQVAKHRHHAGRAYAPVLPQIGYLAFAFLADQNVHHRAFALKQFFNKTLANEAGGTGDEILHLDLQLSSLFLPILRVHHSAQTRVGHGVPPLEN